MRKLIVMLSLLFVIALPAVAHATWKCYASSNSAFGVGFGPTPDDAGYIALRECAVRTPAYDACYIRWCIQVP